MGAVEVGKPGFAPRSPGPRQASRRRVGQPMLGAGCVALFPGPFDVAELPYPMSCAPGPHAVFAGAPTRRPHATASGD